MQELINKLRSLYSSGTCTQRAIADYLAISAPQLSDVFNGRHGLTGAQVFKAQQLLKTVKSQNRLANSATTDDGDDSDNLGDMSKEPATLAQAKARLRLKESQVTASHLQREVASLRSGKAATFSSPILPATPSSSSTGTFTTPPAAKGNAGCGLPFDPQNKETWDGFNKPVIDFPSGCDSPASIAQHLSTVSSETLPWYLRSAPQTPTEKLQRQMVWNEMKARK
jgi:hypothetical protein